MQNNHPHHRGGRRLRIRLATGLSALWLAVFAAGTGLAQSDPPDPALRFRLRWADDVGRVRTETTERTISILSAQGQLAERRVESITCRTTVLEVEEGSGTASLIRVQWPRFQRRILRGGDESEETDTRQGTSQLLDGAAIDRHLTRDKFILPDDTVSPGATWSLQGEAARQAFTTAGMEVQEARADFLLLGATPDPDRGGHLIARIQRILRLSNREPDSGITEDIRYTSEVRFDVTDGCLVGENTRAEGIGTLPAREGRSAESFITTMSQETAYTYARAPLALLRPRAETGVVQRELFRRETRHVVTLPASGRTLGEDRQESVRILDREPLRVNEAGIATRYRLAYHEARTVREYENAEGRLHREEDRAEELLESEFILGQDAEGVIRVESPDAISPEVRDLLEGEGRLALMPDREVPVGYAWVIPLEDVRDRSPGLAGTGGMSVLRANWQLAFDRLNVDPDTGRRTAILSGILVTQGRLPDGGEAASRVDLTIRFDVDRQRLLSQVSVIRQEGAGRAELDNGNAVEYRAMRTGTEILMYEYYPADAVPEPEVARAAGLEPGDAGTSGGARTGSGDASPAPRDPAPRSEGLLGTWALQDRDGAPDRAYRLTFTGAATEGEITVVTPAGERRGRWAWVAGEDRLEVRIGEDFVEFSAVIDREGRLVLCRTSPDAEDRDRAIHPTRERYRSYYLRDE